MDWPRYEELKGQGYSQRAIARELGMAESTLRWLVSRDRPPSQVELSTVNCPPDHVAPSTVDQLLADIRTTLAAELQPLRARLEALETAIATRPAEHAPPTVHHDPVEGPPSHPDTSTGPPSTVHPETRELSQLKRSERWTVYVPRAMKDELKRRAGARGQHPSLLVQEALRRYLAEATP
jgi:transcriptional regulator with XRE-family HTH domain